MLDFECMPLFQNNRRLKDWLLEKRLRMILAGFLTVAVPLVGLTIYVYAQVVAEFKQTILEENEAFFTLAVNLLEGDITTDIANGKIFADRPLLIDAIERDDEQSVRQHLRSLVENSNTIERAAVTTTKAVLLADYPDDPSVAGKDFSHRDWYHGISREWQPYVSDFYLREAEPKRYLFSIAVPVKDSAGTVVGILLIQPKANYLKNILGGIRIGKGFIYAVDKKGNLIYHPDYSLDRIVDFSAVPAVGKVKKGISGVEKGLDPISNEVVISEFRPAKWGWGVVMQRPEKEVFHRAEEIVFGLFLLAGGFLVLGGIVAYNGMTLMFSLQRLSLELREKESREREAKEKLTAELEERKRTEDKLANALAELGRTNIELEQFAYIASHDLQEPLRKISSFAELLEKRYRGQLGEDADRYIHYVVDGASRMRTLIHEMLAYSRLGRGEMKVIPADCNKILSRVLYDMDKAIEDSGAVVTYDALPTIPADEVQIGQVFQNLISNAIKFRRDEPPRIHVSARHEGDTWLFSVSDNGIGMDPAFFDRIFVMFQRLHTRAEYPGTGIGLAACKKIIERHGGVIWVESELGKGSTFHFRLPERRGGEEA